MPEGPPDSGYDGGEKSPQRISMSVETLRTEIRLATAELELRLNRSLASKDALDRVVADVARMDQRVDILERNSAQREPLAVKFENEWDSVKKDVESLKTGKAEDAAVQAYKRYFIGGGVLAALFMAAQLAIAIFVAVSQG